VQRRYQWPLNSLVESRDVRFVLFELLEVEALKKYPKIRRFRPRHVQETLALAEKIAVEQLYAGQRRGRPHRGEVRSATKSVKIPEVFKAPLRSFNEAGSSRSLTTRRSAGWAFAFVGFSCWGTSPPPNMSLVTYQALAHGAAAPSRTSPLRTEEALHSQDALGASGRHDVPSRSRMQAATWARSRPRPSSRPTGTYLITGQKIFITAGDNDFL
jgi:hypothetical protein